ncbi:MAG: AAA family ATPase [Deltaproteobacteria bacterium]|jgi:hypothetical protein|nr:AAA family ATPase [Deltaproteobacteria bacterium]
MTEKLKEIRVEEASFKEIIEGGFIYVDKTGFIHKLITSKVKNYFLSRPRRFGKTLLLETMEEVFSGNEKLFKGLEIGKSDYNFKKHPVLRFNMNIQSFNSEQLNLSLMEMLSVMARGWDVELTTDSFDLSVEELIYLIYEKTKAKVVVLFDEYDDPVASNIHDEDLAAMNAKILRVFYSAFKSSNKFTRFAFVTGVTRYGMMGATSGLNNLTDISLDENYSAICGFTHKELDDNFRGYYKPVLETILKSEEYENSRLFERNAQEVLPLDLEPDRIEISVLKSESDLRDEIFRWYGGYTWDGATEVLNPLSALNFFLKRKFESYWMKTVSSQNFLRDVFKSDPLDFTKDMLSNIPLEDIETVAVGELKPVPFLFHSGYLTIEKFITGIRRNPYFFKAPNLEVKDGYERILTEAASKILVKDSIDERKILLNGVYNRDAAALSDLFEGCYKRLTPEQRKKRHPPSSFAAYLDLKNDYAEVFYSSVLYTYLKALLGGAVVQDESGPGEKPHFTLRLPKNVYAIMEMKYGTKNDRENSDAELDALAKKAATLVRRKSCAVHQEKAGGGLIKIAMGVIGRGDVKILFLDDSPGGIPGAGGESTLGG